LLGPVVELLEVLDKLNALVVGTSHKGFVGHREVEALQGLLSKDTPKPAQRRFHSQQHERERRGRSLIWIKTHLGWLAVSTKAYASSIDVVLRSSLVSLKLRVSYTVRNSASGWKRLEEKVRSWIIERRKT